MAAPVTLQINLAPRDFRFARHLLPHQVKQWGGQVAEILLVIESRRSPGLFGQDWDEGMRAILPLAHSVPNARVVMVDYSAVAQQKVSALFFGGRRSLPAKDTRGGPYYCYFYGLAEAAHDLVYHVDGDMFFGGGSQTWMAEAVEILQTHPEILAIEPLGGPPASSGKIGDSRDPMVQEVRKMENGEPVLVFPTFSSRNFLLDRRKLSEQVGPLEVVPLLRTRPLRRLVKHLLGRTDAQIPEETLSEAMHRRGFCRVHYLGCAPGMWAVHPPVPAFPGYVEMIPRLIARIESGDIPEEQRGYHDINDSMREAQA